MVTLDHLALNQLPGRLTLDYYSIVGHVCIVAGIEGSACIFPPNHPGRALHIGNVPLEGLLVGAGHAAGLRAAPARGRAHGADAGVLVREDHCAIINKDAPTYSDHTAKRRSL